MTKWFLALPLLLLVACGLDDSDGLDASQDGSIADTQTGDIAKSTDASTIDVAPSADATADGSNDATTDDAGPSDSGAGDFDADDGGGDIGDASEDADAAFDGGHKPNCLGVFCISGYSCCNNQSALNFGKCEPVTCISCCK